MTTQSNDDNELANWDEFPELKAISDNMTFAVDIKAVRQCEPWSQAVAAQKLGIHKQLLSAYEGGVKRPSAQEAFRIGQIYGVGGEILALFVLNEQIQEAKLPFKVQLVS